MLVNKNVLIATVTQTENYSKHLKFGFEEDGEDKVHDILGM